jgi:hypothetical protein
VNTGPLADTYRAALLDDLIPFWLRRSLDRERGGYFTCLGLPALSPTGLRNAQNLDYFPRSSRLALPQEGARSRGERVSERHAK